MSEQQKKPNLPEYLQNIKPDDRITEEMQEALPGEANLYGNTVQVIGYVGSEDAYGKSKHYVSYNTGEGSDQFVTIERFTWVHCSLKRQEQLKNAGLDPDKLYDETDPILRSAEEEPTRVLDERDTEIAAAAGAAGAEMAMRKLMGNGRQGAPSREQADKESGAPELNPENFIKRVEHKAGVESAAGESAQEDRYEENRQSIAKRERLARLSEIAKEVAEGMNRKHQDAKTAGDHDVDLYAPESTVEHSWYDRRGKLLAGREISGIRIPKLSRIDRTPQVKASHSVECAEGWILARTASIMDNATIVQEAMLGADGKLYAYAIKDQRYIEKLLGKPLSRKQLKDSGQDLGTPWNTQLSNRPFPRGTLYDENTDPTPRNIYVLDGTVYPLPGVGSKGHIFADPDVIQRGLEELILEKDLLEQLGMPRPAS